MQAAECPAQAPVPGKRSQGGAVSSGSVSSLFFLLKKLNM